MKLRYITTITTFFIAAGLLIGYGPYMQYRRNNAPAIVTTTFSAASGAVLSASTDQPASAVLPTIIEGTPVRITIPSLAIDLKVLNGYYDTTKKTWTLTQDMAQYATITPKANNVKGNTFIYGHDIYAVFARLRRIKHGNQAIIYTDNGHVLTYEFRSSLETNPYDDTLFSYRGAPILTLQTCSGIWSQNRQLFTFDLVGAI
jgi:sortase (surface protein transpeptidase)